MLKFASDCAFVVLAVFVLYAVLVGAKQPQNKPATPRQQPVVQETAQATRFNVSLPRGWRVQLTEANGNVRNLNDGVELELYGHPHLSVIDQDGVVIYESNIIEFNYNGCWQGVENSTDSLYVEMLCDDYIDWVYINLRGWAVRNNTDHTLKIYDDDNLIAWIVADASHYMPGGLTPNSVFNLVAAEKMPVTVFSYPLSQPQAATGKYTVVINEGDSLIEVNPQ